MLRTMLRALGIVRTNYATLPAATVTRNLSPVGIAAFDWSDARYTEGVSPAKAAAIAAWNSGSRTLPHGM